MGGAHILKKNKKPPAGHFLPPGEKSVCSLTKDREKR